MAKGATVAAVSPAGAPAATSVFDGVDWIAPPAGMNPDDIGSWNFRREFTLEGKPQAATLRVIGLGDYDPRLNSRRLAGTGTNQPWSHYGKALYYREFDVTDALTAGPNCLAIVLTNSFWHNQPRKGRYFKGGAQRAAEEPYLLRVELEVTEAARDVRRIVSDELWRTHFGPIAFSHVLAGEDYDARQEQPGWDSVGFDDSGWSPARRVAGPAAELRRQEWPPIASHERYEPISVTEAAPRVWAYAFPQNCSAQLHVRLRGGDAGDRVTFRCGEHRNQRGRLFGHYVISCNITTDGEPIDRRWSSFYLGMQFVEVEGAVPAGEPNHEGLPVIDAIELVHVRADVPEVGGFSCSSELLNDTHRLVDWAMRSNTHHVLTDCPHREKLGWLEVAYLMAPSFQYRYDCRAWHDKILADIRDAQLPSGRVTTVAPPYPRGRFPDKFDWTVEWGAAAVLLPWAQYEWTGDKRVLRDNFDLMRRFVDHVESEADDGIAPGGLGDWYDYGHGQPPGESRYTPTELSSTTTWALCAKRVADAAAILGDTATERRYRTLHEEIARSFQRRIRDPITGDLKNLGSPQCANAMALCADVVPHSDRERLVAQIVADLKRRDWQQTPGDVGHVYLIRALAEAGRSDILHRVYARTKSGSYGGVLAQGLTSMPETWDATMDGYQSLNHCMLGHVMEWLYGYVGGIRQRSGAAGWNDVLIAPEPGPLTQAATSVRVPTGEFTSRWKIEDGVFRLTVSVPEGVTATARLPSGAVHSLVAGRQALAEPWLQSQGD